MPARTAMRSALALAAGLTACGGAARAPAGGAPADPIVETPRQTFAFPDAGVWFSNELDGGRLDDVRSDGDSVFLAVVRPENTPINNSAWYAFKLWSARARPVTVRLTYRGGRHRYWPDVRRTGEPWAPLDSAAVRVDTAAQTATLRLRAGPDTLWVAAQELITTGDVRRWVDSLSMLPHVTRATIGASPRGRAIELLTITANPEATRHVLLIGRQHPPEVTGSMALARFVEEIAGDSPLAREFRTRFQVRVVPVVNPDGVDLGHWRHNTGGVDLNRDWVDFGQPETRAVRDALLRVRGQPGAEVWFAADFHATNRDVVYTLDRALETTPPGFMDRWLARLRAALPDYTLDESISGLASPIARNWFYREFDAPALTYEVGDRTDRALVRRAAAAAARALMELLLAELP